MFAEVAFPISNFKTFTYAIPRDLSKKIHIGSRVKAPLGKRKLIGIIVNILETPPYKGETKSIEDIIDDFQVVTPELWKLISWISNYYMTPLGQVAKTVLPNNLSTRYKPLKILFVESILSEKKTNIELLKKRAPKQYEILNKIQLSKSPLKVSSLTEYSSNPSQICKILSGKKLVRLFEKESIPSSSAFSFDPVDKKIIFNQDQERVSKSLQQSLENEVYMPFLLHGVTGSGKTEIYIEAVRYCLKQGRTAIILLPEISLTPQIAGRFKSVFGDTIALWHSKLTQRQRSWTWKEICKGSYKVIIGARSAVFSPLKKLGLVVIDEEQEASFRQDSPMPRYHARDVALMRAKFNNAVIVLASATPSLESYYNYLNEKLNYLYLPNRYGDAKYPIVHLVDMLEEQNDTGKFGQIISGLLQDKIEERLNNKEQIIILQNRRGFSPVIRCGDCGQIIICPYCNVSISYHIKTDNLLCHFCGHSKVKLDQNCSDCNSKNLHYSGTGTQKVEILLRDTFPKASIQRLDMDTSLSGRNITNILKAFNNGEIDILLGTQMIAKGLDFPNATLVGIINADQGLYLPDFRSGERIFQLIYQASGRSGRRNKQGEVVIQTYSSENPVIKSASMLDMKKYYEIALKEREELDYPPYSWLAKIEITGSNQEKTSILAINIAQAINGDYAGLSILGPVPCYLEKLRNNFRFQIIIKSVKTLDPNGKKLHSFINRNFNHISQKHQIGKARIKIHFDPLSLI